MAIDQTPPTPARRQRYYIGTDGADHPVVRRVTVPPRASSPMTVAQAPAPPPPAPLSQAHPAAATSPRDTLAPATPIRPATVAVPVATGAGEPGTETTPAPAVPHRIFPVRPPRLLDAVRRHRAND